MDKSHLPGRERRMIEYRISPGINGNAIGDLRESVGWNRMDQVYRDPRLQSFCCIGAFDGEKLVGYVDCVSNGVTDAYIQDLMVHPSYQGQGIGTQLMNRIIDYLKCKQIYMISVIYDASLKSFYKKFGFCEMLSGQLQTYDCE